MAAPTGKMVGVSDESSSEDDEDIEKLKEAVWTTQGAKKTGSTVSYFDIVSARLYRNWSLIPS